MEYRTDTARAGGCVLCALGWYRFAGPGAVQTDRRLPAGKYKEVC